MLPAANTYEQLREQFRWHIPERYNIAADVCDRWAQVQPERTAIIHESDVGTVTTLSFAALQTQANRLANLLAQHGIARGDRVGILLPQCPETAISHVAVLKLGAIAIPLFTLFGPDALQHRLADAGVRAIITDQFGAAKVAGVRSSLPALELALSIDGGSDATNLPPLLAQQSTAFATIDTHANDPAFIIYTSGTTGQPKGALHAHRTLLGHLPGVEMSHDLFPVPGDRIWTPADWAWIGGLLDVLMPALHHGVPVISRRFAKFSGEAAFELMARHDVRNAFIPPTALKMMRAVPDAAARWRINLRTVASGGETLGAELLDWGRRALGVTINEFYGQTECNMVVSSCARLMPARPGLMGRPVPGHDVAVIDAEGRICASGERGQIAVRKGDPVMFLGYWNNPTATAAKFRGDWLVMGDEGVSDNDGTIRFIGRDDDIITSSGYRIGPGEIEDCLLQHPAVRLACVVGKTDPLRTEIVKAYIVPAEGLVPDKALASELSAHVRDRLAAHEYPREIDFVDELPLTTTGKIIRRKMRERARVEGKSDDI